MNDSELNSLSVIASCNSLFYYIYTNYDVIKDMIELLPGFLDKTRYHNELFSSGCFRFVISQSLENAEDLSQFPWILYIDKGVAEEGKSEEEGEGKGKGEEGKGEEGEIILSSSSYEMSEEITNGKINSVDDDFKRNNKKQSYFNIASFSHLERFSFASSSLLKTVKPDIFFSVFNILLLLYRFYEILKAENEVPYDNGKSFEWKQQSKAILVKPLPKMIMEANDDGKVRGSVEMNLRTLHAISTKKFFLTPGSAPPDSFFNIFILANSVLGHLCSKIVAPTWDKDCDDWTRCFSVIQDKGRYIDDDGKPYLMLEICECVTVVGRLYLQTHQLYSVNADCFV